MVKHLISKPNYFVIIRQGKDGMDTKNYSVIKHLLSFVVVYKRL